MFSLFNQYFQHDSLPFFCGFSAIFTLLASEHEHAINLGTVMYWCDRDQYVVLKMPLFSIDCDLKMQEMSS